MTDMIWCYAIPTKLSGFALALLHSLSFMIWHGKSHTVAYSGWLRKKVLAAYTHTNFNFLLKLYMEKKKKALSWAFSKRVERNGQIKGWAFQKDTKMPFFSLSWVKISTKIKDGENPIWDQRPWYILVYNHSTDLQHHPTPTQIKATNGYDEKSFQMPWRI